MRAQKIGNNVLNIDDQTILNIQDQGTWYD